MCVCGGDERSVLSQKAAEETVSRTAGECVSIPWVYWGLQVGQCTLGQHRQDRSSIYRRYTGL
jgi:hypothetical protein